MHIQGNLVYKCRSCGKEHKYYHENLDQFIKNPNLVLMALHYCKESTYGIADLIRIEQLGEE